MSMGNNTVVIPTKAWYGDRTLTLKFPAKWEVHECRMAGHGTKSIGLDAIESVRSCQVR
jgi:hypothetical protein